MSRTSKKTKFLRALYRLSPKDKAVLLLLLGLVVGGLAYGVFKVSNLGLVGMSSVYPESTLFNTNKINTRKHYTFGELPYMVVFPGTNEAAYVGGNPLDAYANGQAFQLADGVFEVLAIGPKDTSSEAVLKGLFVPLVTGQEMDCRFNKKVQDKGYLNAMPVEYIGGELISPGGDKLHCIAYRYDVPVSELSIYMGMIVNDSGELKEAKKHLDKIFFTLCEVTEVPEEEQNRQESTSHRTTEKMLTADALVRERRDREHTVARLRLSDGAPEYIQKSMELEAQKTGQNTVFFFSYTNKNETPSKAMLVTPDGMVKAPDSMNSTYPGKIVFKVRSAIAGSYTLKVTNDIDFGYCAFSMLSADEFSRIFDKGSVSGNRG